MEMIIWIVLVFGGHAVHALKKIVERRKGDKSYGVRAYYSANPYQHALSAIGAMSLFLLALDNGAMNNFTALSAGYMGDSIGNVLGASTGKWEPK